MKYSGWPEQGELVVGEVEDVNEERGVYVDLSEYRDKRGFIHISEVASGWIKNIRDHASEGERVVCKVLDVDESAQQINLSIKDVNDHQRKDKIQDWKNEQKADNWMELAFGEDLDDEKYASVANVLLAEFGSMYAGFEEAAIHGSEALEETDLDDDEVEAIVETARENVSVPYVTVTGYVDLQIPDGDGVEVIKDALKAAEGNGEVPASDASGGSEDSSSGVPEEVDLEVTYVGSPEYRIRVQAPDYKTAEGHLEESAERATEVVEDAGGTGTYHRERNVEEE